MAPKMITIAFRQGGSIPAEVLNLANDRECNALEPVQVPEFYGRSLIQDRIAIPAELPVDQAEKPARTAEKPKDTPKPRTTKPKEPASATLPPQDQPDTSIITLLGSNVLTDLVEIAAGKTVQLGEIVVKAHEKSGLSIEEWNALPEADREAALTAVVDELKAAETQQQP